MDCPAIDGIIDEAQEVNSEIADKSVLYGTLIAWAQCLGKTDCVPPLRETLEEEKAADAKLTALANQTINRRAA